MVSSSPGIPINRWHFSTSPRRFADLIEDIAVGSLTLFLIANNINPKKSMYAGIKDKDQLLEILEEGTVYTYCNN